MVSPETNNSLPPDAPYPSAMDPESEGKLSLNGDVTTSIENEPPAVQQAKPALQHAEDPTTRVLRFLSTASNETIGGVALGLAACTYVILGKLGLILIGMLGGIVLHATWESQTMLTGITGDARRENGLDVVKRVLDWRDARDVARDDEAERDNDALSIYGRGFEGFRPETGAALTELVEAIIRDYVKWWYGPILPADESFPAAARRTLTGFLRSISNHLSRKRPADAFLDFLTNSTSIVIVFLNELSSAIAASPGSNASDAVNKYLASNPESSLANVLNDRQQKKKFKMISEDILENFIEKPVYSCDPARIFLREILAGVVMEMSLTTCSKPEWINGWIVYLLEEGEPEFGKAIDAGMGVVPADDLDGTLGNVGIAKAKRSEEKKHRKRLSKAEEAMEEAVEEAKRLSQLIADEDMKRQQEIEKSANQNRVSTLVDLPKEPDQLVERFASESSQDVSSGDDSVGHNTPKTGSGASSPKTPAIISSGDAGVAAGRGSSFTSFDQLVLPVQPQSSGRSTILLTLHNALITVYDDSSVNDKGRMRNKPTTEYWVQIEPEGGHHPGWMIMRKYSDFETLHEVLRRIAAISGVAAFMEQHRELPSWKAHTKASLRGELERYLRDACWHQTLAESEGMKRFLEKDQGQPLGNNKGFSGLGWPTPTAFENMGKGMLDVLTSAPKGAAEGGKAVLGGVTGVLGNIGSLGQKKRDSTISSSTQPSAQSSNHALPTLENAPVLSGTRRGRESEESIRSSPVIQTQPGKIPPMERKPSVASILESGNEGEIQVRNRSSMSAARSARSSASNSREPSQAPTPLSRSHSATQLADLESGALPPPPSDMPDDYSSPTNRLFAHSRTDSMFTTPRTSTSGPSSTLSPTRTSISSNRPSLPPRTPTTTSAKRDPLPLSESETRVAVELLFAVINELYTLSSAWNIRRTLLTAAKTFLLRPNNPSLISIQALIQDSVISSNTSDAGIAQQLRKMRENTMPTETELAAWPAELSPEEKENLRIKARKLLMERGVPAALTGVMGTAATAEAMGRLFDCLQVEEVARGLMFGLLLQAVRAIAH